MHGLDSLIGDSSVLTFCKGLVLLFTLLNIQSAFKKNYKGGTGYVMLFLVMVIYCVFYTPKTGDSYTSMDTYYLYLSGGDYRDLHFEMIYFYLMDFIPFGYVYYRLVVWGVACLLFVWLMKKMSVKSSMATLSVLTFALPILLYYQRAAFAYVLIYFATYCYVSKDGLLESKGLFHKKYLLTFVVLLLCAIPFHRTMPVYIAVLLCAIFIPKNMFGIMILLLGTILFSTSVVSNSIFMLDLLQEDTRATGMLYLENGVVSTLNLKGWIAYYLWLLPIICMMIYELVKMIKSPNSLIEIEKICLINSLLLIVMSICFMAYSFSIQVKFRNAAMMPWTIFLASYYTRNSGNKVCSFYALATIVVSIFQ